MTSGRPHRCSFCPPHIEAKVVERCGTVVAIADEHPVTEGHMLVVPTRHTRDFFSMTSEEKKDADRLIQLLRRKIEASDPAVTGFNIGVNCGKSAGQTIMHAHIHLIPRRDGDIARPEGGVRGVIPDKREYSNG
ncbi:MAG: HIT family protein [Sedimentisphaerales bacterium]|nr:HIT family protein [Sedimentisphaerales bacterium]